MSSVAHAVPTRELVLDRYRPVRPLGSGGNGSVWLAQDVETGLDVALKIVPREGKAAARAEREAHAARRLRHERCVRAYDVGHDGGHVYIAYEYVPGRTVREALRAGDLSDGQIVEVAAQVLEALAHAHRTGIVHRDVKPSNVLLQDTGEVSARLLDFGLAQFDGADTLTAVGDVPGTLAYISPERLAGEDATPASDVWAVGVLVWESLAGEHPFWGMPLQEVALAIEKGAPPLASRRPDLPRRLLSAVDSALSLDPARRPRASALALELRAALRPAERRMPRASQIGEAELSFPAASLVRRVLPAALAVATAAIGVTLLPFWPTPLAVAIVLACGPLAAYKPRLGLAFALATPIFPLGNLSQGAAVLYGALAAGWLALFWRQARFGLLFALGPLAAAVGALALVPLAVQPVRGLVRRGLLAATAVLTAVLVADVSGSSSPISPVSHGSLGVTPADSSGSVALALWAVLAGSPVILAAAGVTGLAAAALPGARKRGRFGVAVVGAIVIAGAIATGSLLAAIPLVLPVWGAAAALAARPRG